ncbi:hypothetical protein EVJ58_g4294 [Rhodofomes roseus]|uniref:Uncharacterized protein n=1 Tax=Rhodofomes roseus TaxID=34475 RepID=A0A4Y9YJZ2_9APHY|nr:hypothetical protein EVJ58_g4294 [Rhodofomes roseus]
MRFIVASPFVFSLLSVGPAFAAPIAYANVGHNSQKIGNTALNAISLGTKAYPLRPFIREDQGALLLNRRELNGHTVGDDTYPAANKATGVATTAADVPRDSVRRAVELELRENPSLSGSDINWKKVGHVNWKKAGHVNWKKKVGHVKWKKVGRVAGKVAGYALPLAPLLLVRELELDELD